MIYSKILVAYDGSNESEEALKHAVMLCEYFPTATLIVVHAYSAAQFMIGEAMYIPSAEANNDALIQAQAVLDNALTLISNVPGATVELVNGNAGESIVAMAQDKFCDLIVTGSRGLGSVKEFILGSVSHYVVQHALIPVLVVK